MTPTAFLFLSAIVQPADLHTTTRGCKNNIQHTHCITLINISILKQITKRDTFVINCRRETSACWQENLISIFFFVHWNIHQWRFSYVFCSLLDDWLVCLLVELHNLYLTHFNEIFSKCVSCPNPTCSWFDISSRRSIKKACSLAITTKRIDIERSNWFHFLTYWTCYGWLTFKVKGKGHWQHIFVHFSQID